MDSDMHTIPHSLTPAPGVLATDRPCQLGLMKGGFGHKKTSEDKRREALQEKICLDYQRLVASSDPRYHVYTQTESMYYTCIIYL